MTSLLTGNNHRISVIENDSSGAEHDLPEPPSELQPRRRRDPAGHEPACRSGDAVLRVGMVS